VSSTSGKESYLLVLVILRVYLLLGNDSRDTDGTKWEHTNLDTLLVFLHRCSLFARCRQSACGETVWMASISHGRGDSWYRLTGDFGNYTWLSRTFDE
jgi:hypothetical protein